MAETERSLILTSTPAEGEGHAEAQMICRSDALQEGGDGEKFQFEYQGRIEPAFVIRWQGKVRGYLNRCGHVPVELDYQPKQFFDFSGQYLVCATHGALYDPATGACMGGRCNGKGLVPVPVLEDDGAIYLQASSKESK